MDRGDRADGPAAAASPRSVEDDAVPDVRDAVGHVAYLRVVGDDQERPALALRQGAE